LPAAVTAPAVVVCCAEHVLGQLLVCQRIQQHHVRLVVVGLLRATTAAGQYNKPER
jgi:hypothetical protein